MIDVRDDEESPDPTLMQHVGFAFVMSAVLLVVLALIYSVIVGGP